MSLNEENFEQYLNQPQTITEFIHVILTSLNKIVRRVNDLDKHIEDLFGKLDKEIHNVSFKLQNLQENIIQLTDIIAHKIPNEVLSMEVWKSRKSLPNITIETQQVYSCTSLPVNIFERNDANTAISLLALPSYYQNDMEDSSSSDSSFHSCLYCSKFVQEIVHVNKEQVSEKYIQEKNLDHDRNKLQCQLVKEHHSVDHIPASGCAIAHSYLDQSEGGSSLYIFPLNKSKPQEKSATNNLPGEQEHLHYNFGRMSHSRPRVLYGTGKGDVMLSQPPSLIRCKREAFVNPRAPEAPPLPSDWLIQLTSSKRPSAARIVNSVISPVTSSLVVLETTTSACLKTTSNIDLKMPPKFTSAPASHECLELQPGDLSPQSQDQMITSLLPPSVIALSKSWDSALDLIDTVLSEQCSICQPMKSFPKSPKSAKSPESPSKSRSASGPLPQNQVSNTSDSSSAQLPRFSSVPRSVSVPASSSHKTQMSSNSSPSPKRSVSHLTKLIEAQSRLQITNSKKSVSSPPLKLSCLTSTKVTTLQSSLSSMKSTSVSSHRSFAITQHVNSNPGNQSRSSSLPIMNNARKALMEDIRSGVQLRKIQKQRSRAELAEKEADMIRDRRRAMGYNSGKSDSESEWAY
uniref:wiskott-Aldrich syndrome protein family member 1-like n=1 Tax=Myodes glareolus TaxID=447135 RepID=UPI002020079E|nr:wiskott-Aldrich syndrome protein family member 1-like [Myodes glareolus]XP_048273960.1 wiskott-Aldrich syndrome protein family member 1-like [Myodes glareolus]